MKIYFDTTTNKFAGVSTINPEYKTCTTISYIEIDDEEWVDFLKANPDTNIKVIKGKLVAKPIVFSLEEQKQRLINVRKMYLQNNDWQKKKVEEKQFLNLDVTGDIIEYTPVWVKKDLLRNEINEIEVATEETINNYSMEI